MRIIQCMQEKNLYVKNCIRGKDIETKKQHLTQNKIEFNRRFGMPIFIPLVALISCFLLLSRNEKKISGFYKYIFFFIGFAILVGSEITVRYSGTSLHHAARSEEHTSELQSRTNLVCRLLLEKKKN